MAINVYANSPNAVVAKQSGFFVDIGLNVNNIHIIYLVDRDLFSWKPERFINAINGFEAGKGYYIIPKTDLDLDAYLIPSLPPIEIYTGVYD